MKARYSCWALMVVVLVLNNGCMLDEEVHSDVGFMPKRTEYSPGFTGYTSGYGGYGGYLNGYGPAYWNPRYIYYTGYQEGYGPSN